MTQSQFQAFVKMPVSPQEFGAIKQVYLACDVSFESFCRRWMRMNTKRIREWKASNKH